MGQFIWDNFYDEETRINEYDLTLFVKEADGRFSRFEETHYQRGYTLAEMKALVEEAGLAFVAAYDAFRKEPPREDSERIYIVVREKGKKR